MMPLLAVLNEITIQFPSENIGGVILSYNHFDHAGGSRAALSKGGDLIIGESSVAFYKVLLTRSHSMRDNPIDNRKTVKVGVKNKLVLGEGHADDGDMIVLYRPHDKTLFFAELYNSDFGVLQNFFPNLVSNHTEKSADAG